MERAMPNQKEAQREIMKENEKKDRKRLANEKSVANYNTINSYVLKVLIDVFNNKDNKYIETIKNAIETLEANQLEIDGFTKLDYDKDSAIRNLMKARETYELFRHHINCAIICLKESPVSVTDFEDED